MVAIATLLELHTGNCSGDKEEEAQFDVHGVTVCVCSLYNWYLWLDGSLPHVGGQTDWLGLWGFREKPAVCRYWPSLATGCNTLSNQTHYLTQSFSLPGSNHFNTSVRLQLSQAHLQHRKAFIISEQTRSPFVVLCDHENIIISSHDLNLLLLRNFKMFPPLSKSFVFLLFYDFRPVTSQQTHTPLTPPSSPTN